MQYNTDTMKWFKSFQDVPDKWRRRTRAERVLLLETCIKRDPHGLYRKAMAGEIAEFTGISLSYEEPQFPEILVDTDLQGIEQVVDLLLTRLIQAQIIQENDLLFKHGEHQ